MVCRQFMTHTGRSSSYKVAKIRTPQSVGRQKPSITSASRPNRVPKKKHRHSGPRVRSVRNARGMRSDEARGPYREAVGTLWDIMKCLSKIELSIDHMAGKRSVRSLALHLAQHVIKTPSPLDWSSRGRQHGYKNGPASKAGPCTFGVQESAIILRHQLHNLISSGLPAISARLALPPYAERTRRERRL